MWNILCYVSQSGKNEIQDTYKKGNAELKASLEVAFEFLKAQDKSSWIRPKAAKMSKCKMFRDFYEVRFFANNTQQRPIGFFGPGRNDFTILLWATEKGGSLIPDGWCKQANDRMNQIKNAKASTAKLTYQ